MKTKTTPTLADSLHSRFRTWIRKNKPVTHKVDSRLFLAFNPDERTLAISRIGFVDMDSGLARGGPTDVDVSIVQTALERAFATTNPFGAQPVVMREELQYKERPLGGYWLTKRLRWTWVG